MRQSSSHCPAGVMRDGTELDLPECANVGLRAHQIASGVTTCREGGKRQNQPRKPLQLRLLPSRTQTMRIVSVDIKLYE